MLSENTEYPSEYPLVDAIDTPLQPYCKIEGDGIDLRDTDLQCEQTEGVTTFYVPTEDVLEHIDRHLCWDVVLDNLVMKGKNIPFDENSNQKFESLKHFDGPRENIISFYPRSLHTKYRNQIYSNVEPVRVSLDPDNPEKDQYYPKGKLIEAMKSQDWTQNEAGTEYYPPLPSKTCGDADKSSADHLETAIQLINPLIAQPNGNVRKIYLTKFIDNSQDSESETQTYPRPNLRINVKNNKIQTNLGEKLLEISEISKKNTSENTATPSIER